WPSSTTDEPGYVGGRGARPRRLGDGGRQVLLAHGQEALRLGLGLALPLVRQVVVGRPWRADAEQASRLGAPLRRLDVVLGERVVQVAVLHAARRRERGHGVEVRLDL